MPFELFNTPASLQSYINKIPVEKLNLFIIIYLNDNLIYIKDLNQSYVKALRYMLDIFQKHEFFDNLKKCQFYKDEIYFFSYIILA